MQALATTLIAAIAVWIAFMQWRTAHLKTVLDLFDRRKGVYLAAKTALAYAQRDADAKDEAWENIRKARLEAQFLFPREIDQKLDAISSALTDLNVAVAENDIPKRRKALDEIEAFFNELYDVFAKYMPPSVTAARNPDQIIKDFGAWLRALVKR